MVAALEREPPEKFLKRLIIDSAGIQSKQLHNLERHIFLTLSIPDSCLLSKLSKKIKKENQNDSERKIKQFAVSNPVLFQSIHGCPSPFLADNDQRELLIAQINN